ncbi:EamA family transporter [Neolewinella aurantiaca]|uniref:EamA family transporter n=1 Tax=Neolewinella aurantiaca TaxID=2602767 RepID=A0A5C7FM56_9BACT|nr:DMT family transporter [Neolewinella aurantiaca]TXF91158.1 EamA family transporter [Neolewinella aurantiaca]
MSSISETRAAIVADGNRFTGLLLTLGGAVLFSCKAIVIKLSYLDYEVSSIVLLGLRMAFALPFFLLIGYLKGKRTGDQQSITPGILGVVVVLGVFGYYLASYTDFIGLQYLSAGMERLILFSYPTMVLLLQRVAFKTPIKPVQWLATLLCYAGIGLAFSGSDFSFGDNFSLGAGLVFLSALLYSFYVIGSGKITPRIGSIRFTSMAMLAACAVVLLHVLASGNTLLGLPSGLYGYAIILAIFCTVIPGYMVTEGIRRIGANDAAILGAVGPVATIVLEFFILGEHLNLVQALGAGLVILGVVIIGRSK